MTIRLDPPRLRELQRLARDAGLRPGQLAQRWVEERLAVGPAGASAAGAPGGARDDSQTDGSPQLDRLSELVADHTARLDHLAAQVAALTAAPPQQPATDRGDSGRRPRLHEEILAVLRESGRAMSAGEIAQAIRDRGNYRAPRSNEQVNGAMVSGRVSNPHYRSLFVRDGRRIGLVEHAGGR